MTNKIKQASAASKAESIQLPGRRSGWLRKRNNSWEADYRLPDGRRKKKCSHRWTKDDAINWLRSEALQLQEQGNAALKLNDKQRMDAARAIEILNGTGATLEQAATHYKQHLAPALAPKSVTAVANEYLADAKEKGLRDRSVGNLRHRLGKLTKKFGRLQISEVTTTMARNWISEFRKLSPMTQKHYRTAACGMWNFAKALDYTASNPFTAQNAGRRIRASSPAPQTFRWQDVRALLAAAEKEDASMVAPLAIGFFAGLRSAELLAIRWEDINLANKRIHVPSGIAKNKHERHVTIEDNLAQWLTAYLKDSGPVVTQGKAWRYRLKHITTTASVNWIHNGMRHSYASYHCVRYQDNAKTAFQLGHGKDTDMLEEHYKHLRTPEEATEYWNIRPNTDS